MGGDLVVDERWVGRVKKSDQFYRSGLGRFPIHIFPPSSSYTTYGT